MGYSDLIDRLLDTRINEGMISSISKNKDRKGGHSLRFLKDGKSKIKLSGGFI